MEYSFPITGNCNIIEYHTCQVRIEMFILLRMVVIEVEIWKV